MTHAAAGRATAADRRLRERAAAVIPGGMYGHLNSKGLPPGYPQFFESGEGALVRDVDGNEYVDLMCSWGPIILGHGDPAVDAAVAAQQRRGDCLDGPTPLFVETAELLVDTIDHADWAMFAKNGTDATTLCTAIARAATGRRKVLVARGAYHGAASWSTPGRSGVTAEDRANTVYFDYNDLASAEAAAAEAGPDDVALVMVTPLRHDLRRDLEAATPEFATGLRALCDRIGAALAIDDVRAGFRVTVGGSWEPLGVRPDLSAWSKAIANGHPLACVMGTDPLRDAAASVFTTGSFWLAALPMAAASATITQLRETDAHARIGRAGRRLRAGLAAQADAHGLAVTLSGPVEMPFMTFADDDDFARASLWSVTAIEHGVFAHPFHNWFLSAALTDELVDRALAGTDEAFAAVKERFGDG
jgi:glutamate-1-semialdehyde 2,1-aminomutase